MNTASHRRCERLEDLLRQARLQARLQERPPRRVRRAIVALYRTTDPRLLRAVAADPVHAKCYPLLAHLARSRSAA